MMRVHLQYMAQIFISLIVAWGVSACADQADLTTGDATSSKSSVIQAGDVCSSGCIWSSYAVSSGLQAAEQYCGYEECACVVSGDASTSCVADDYASDGQPDSTPTPAGSSQLPDVPYFYQYDNALYPSASCQNTSVAMVLSYLGWSGTPDQITGRYGKDWAQSPAGLAALFNTYADNERLSMKLEPITSGSISGLRAELDRGHPVIVHGYFTSYGHVLVVLGYDASGYYVHDPAGLWSGYFKGGYSGGGSGRKAHYSRSVFEAAIGTSDGYSALPLWYHALR